MLRLYLSILEAKSADMTPLMVHAELRVLLC